MKGEQHFNLCAGIISVGTWKGHVIEMVIVVHDTVFSLSICTCNLHAFEFFWVSLFGIYEAHVNLLKRKNSFTLICLKLNAVELVNLTTEKNPYLYIYEIECSRIGNLVAIVVCFAYSWVILKLCSFIMQLANILGNFHWLTCPRKVIFVKYSIYLTL